MSTSKGTLLVPVANPETLDRLLDTAIDVARERSMRILALHVVEVPAQVPLTEGDRLVEDDGEEETLLDDADSRITAAGLDVDTRLRYARDIATGIVGAVDEHDADALLAGWRGRPRRRDIVLGSFLDRLLGEAACDVFVKRIRSTPEDVDSILVPVAGGPHTELAVELAGNIAAQRDAKIHLVTVQQPGASETERAEVIQRLEAHASHLQADEIPVETERIEHDDVAGAITDETASHDLTLLGATRDSYLKRKLVGSVAQGVGRSAASSVILTRRAPSTGT